MDSSKKSASQYRKLQNSKTGIYRFNCPCCRPRGSFKPLMRRVGRRAENRDTEKLLTSLLKGDNDE